MALLHLFLRLLPLGIIPETDNNADGLAVLSQRSCAEYHRKEAAVLANKSVRVIAKPNFLLQHTQTGAITRGERRTVGMLVMGDIMHLLSEELSPSPSKHLLGGRIYVCQKSVRVDGIQSFGHCVHHGLAIVG